MKHKITTTLTSKWKNDITPKQQWNDIVEQTSNIHKSKKMKVSNTQRQSLESWKYKTVFKHTYPRLDVNVSKMQNHLLKSPFCVHPKTGRVCVPINVSKIDDFDPFTVPTLVELCEELMSEKEGKGMKYWKESLDYFEKSFLIPLKKSVFRQEKERKEELAGIMG